MTKWMLKTIMERTHFRNRFLKNPTNESRLAYARPKNFLRISPLKRKKCNILQTYSEKNKSRENVTLVKNEEIISDDVEVANILNTFFSNII